MEEDESDERRAGLYGLMAEFENPTDLVEAARKAREAGFTKLDAYSPYPIEALTEALDIHDRKLPAVVLARRDHRRARRLRALLLDFGHRLSAERRRQALPQRAGLHRADLRDDDPLRGVRAVFGMLALNGLPMPYHPVFNAPRFALASRDRFFLCIEAKDPKFDHDETWAFLTQLGPRVVMDVEE